MRFSSNFKAAAFVGLAGLLVGPAGAQPTSDNMAVPAHPVAAPAPAIASFTAAQATAGEAAYRAGCMDCHGANLDDGEFGGPPLKGKIFQAHWFGKPVSNLVRFTFAEMPPDAPGRMPLENYSEITAYILSVNGMTAGDRALPGDFDSLGKTILPAPGP